MPQPHSATNTQDGQDQSPFLWLQLKSWGPPSHGPSLWHRKTFTVAWEGVWNMTTDPQGMVWEWKEGFLPQESWGALTRKRGTEAGQELCSVRGGEEREGREGWLLRPVQPAGRPGLLTCQRTGAGGHVEKDMEQERPERSETRGLEK